MFYRTISKPFNHKKNLFYLFMISSFLLFYSCKDNAKIPIEVKTSIDSMEIKKDTSSIHHSKVPDHYICFTNDKNTSRRIWVSFTKDNIAIEIKYEGQTEGIELKFTHEEYIEGGTHPTIINYYDEIYNGTINGRYKLTHSGIWDYLEYTRGRDSKTFNFTIDHNADPYGKTPCF